MQINFNFICLDRRPQRTKISTNPEGTSSDQLGSISGELSTDYLSPISEESDPHTKLIEAVSKRGGMIGSFRLFLEYIELDNLKPNIHSVFCVIKFNHHWAMTSSELAQPVIHWKWILQLPVHDPASLVSITVFGSGGGAGRMNQVTRIGKLRVRLSTFKPDVLYDRNLPFLDVDGGVIGRAKVTAKVVYNSEAKLMQSYFKSEYDGDFYSMGLGQGSVKAQIKRDSRKLIMQ